MREVTLYTLKAQTVVCHGPEVILSRAQFDRLRVTREGDHLEINIKEVACPVHDIHRGRGRSEFLAFDPDILPVVEFLGRKELETTLERERKYHDTELRRLEDKVHELAIVCDTSRHRQSDLRIEVGRLVSSAMDFTGAPLYRRLLYALKGKLP